MAVIEPQTHEVRGNLLYANHGDKPYWALRSIFSHEINGGVKNIEVEVEGEQWTVSLAHQKSGLQPRTGDSVDQLYEYRMNAYGHGERKIPLLIQPRLGWADDDRAPNSVPSGLGEATNVNIQTATNIEPDEIRRLFPKILKATFDELGVGWNSKFFAGSVHQYSNITQWELYVRIQRAMAKKIVKMDGILWRIFHLLGNLEGSKFVYSNDNTEILGYNHQVRVDRKAASEIMPGRQLGKQFKHYHPQHVRDEESEDDPLYHPKFGVLFKSGLNNNSVPWFDRRDLRDELHENLINVLEWAGIPTQPGPYFIPDDHFDPKASDNSVAIYDDPTPEIEAEQESILTKTLLSICDSERDQKMLEEVALADGGEVHVSELKDEVGSSSTIYRGLKKLKGVLKSDNGNVQYVSEKIRQQVIEIISVTEDVIESKTQILEDVLSVDPRDLERAGRAWQNWMDRYGAELVENLHGPARIRIREILSLVKSKPGEWAPEVVHWGKIAWANAGRDPATFKHAVVEFDRAAGDRKAVRVSKLLRELD